MSSAGEGLSHRARHLTAAPLPNSPRSDFPTEMHPPALSPSITTDIMLLCTYILV